MTWFARETRRTAVVVARRAYGSTQLWGTTGWRERGGPSGVLAYTGVLVCWCAGVLAVWDAGNLAPKESLVLINPTMEKLTVEGIGVYGVRRT